MHESVLEKRKNALQVVAAPSAEFSCFELGLTKFARKRSINKANGVIRYTKLVRGNSSLHGTLVLPRLHVAVSALQPPLQVFPTSFLAKMFSLAVPA